MVYGPVGAFLAEFFPSSDPLHVGVGAYHIGNGWAAVGAFITSAAARTAHRLCCSARS
jgi:hypothetical protein